MRLGAVLCSRIEGTESSVAQLPLFEGDAQAAAPRTKPGLDRPAGSTLQAASFFPPPVEAMHAALANLEWVLHEGELLSLTAPALSHDQFETVHPCLDGNGRIGRLLVPLALCQRGVLPRSSLSLSTDFDRHRSRFEPPVVRDPRDRRSRGRVRALRATGDARRRMAVG